MFSVSDLLEEHEQKSDTELEIREMDVNPFSLVTAPIRTTIRDNSLYRLVEELLPQNLSDLETKGSAESSLLSAYRVESITDDKAWLIHFDTVPENSLFSREGFRFQYGHLRIDAHFANDNTLKAKQGFTSCHSTEQYRHRDTGDSITAHVYIGSNGSFIGCQIKNYKRGQKDGRQMEVTPLLKKMIYKNSRPVLALAKKLLTEKHNRYLKAEKKIL